MIRKNIEGHVYIIQLENHALIKIGCTTKPSQRLRTLSTQSGLRIARQFVSTAHSNYKSNEHRMHGLFRYKRRHGEYFAVDFIDAVQSLTKLFLG